MTTTYRLVLPNYLNHYGLLYGGQLLQWIDEAGYIAVSLTFPDREFVTVGLNEVVFHKRIHKGSILQFDSNLIKQGTTSATFEITVIAHYQGTQEVSFSNQITFVSVDKNGNKVPI
jgi:acyl-CoA hydrolase